MDNLSNQACNICIRDGDDNTIIKLKQLIVGNAAKNSIKIQSKEIILIQIDICEAKNKDIDIQ